VVSEPDTDIPSPCLVSLPQILPVLSLHRLLLRLALRVLDNLNLNHKPKNLVSLSTKLSLVHMGISYFILLQTRKNTLTVKHHKSKFQSNTHHASDPNQLHPPLIQQLLGLRPNTTAAHHPSYNRTETETQPHLDLHHLNRFKHPTLFKATRHFKQQHINRLPKLLRFNNGKVKDLGLPGAGPMGRLFPGYIRLIAATPTKLRKSLTS
jgi:hypothetical protein